MNTTECLKCGTNIENKRKDAKYCSDRCRMQFRRLKKKIRLIAELIEYCSQIPNHVSQEGNRITGVRVRDENTGKYKELSTQELKSLSQERLKSLIRSKITEFQAHQLKNNI